MTHSRTVINIGCYKANTSAIGIVLSNLYYTPFIISGTTFNSLESAYMYCGYPINDSNRLGIKELYGQVSKKSGRNRKKDFFYFDILDCNTPIPYDFKEGLSRRYLEQLLFLKFTRNSIACIALHLSGNCLFTHKGLDGKDLVSEGLPGDFLCNFLVQLRSQESFVGCYDNFKKDPANHNIHDLFDSVDNFDHHIREEYRRLFP